MANHMQVGTVKAMLSDMLMSFDKDLDNMQFYIVDDQGTIYEKGDAEEWLNEIKWESDLEDHMIFTVNTGDGHINAIEKIYKREMEEDGFVEAVIIQVDDMVNYANQEDAPAANG